MTEVGRRTGNRLRTRPGLHRRLPHDRPRRNSLHRTNAQQLRPCSVRRRHGSLEYGRRGEQVLDAVPEELFGDPAGRRPGQRHQGPAPPALQLDHGQSRRLAHPRNRGGEVANTFLGRPPSGDDDRVETGPFPSRGTALADGYLLILGRLVQDRRPLPHLPGRPRRTAIHRNRARPANPGAADAGSRNDPRTTPKRSLRPRRAVASRSSFRLCRVRSVQRSGQCSG